MYMYIYIHSHIIYLKNMNNLQYIMQVLIHLHIKIS